MDESQLHARAKAVFLEVCDLAAEQRAAALASACGEDHELRARVAALLEFEDRNPAFLDEPHRASPALETVPRFIGPFRVRRKLGEGGMGTVWEVEQDRPHRAVALKLLRLDLSTADRFRRFEREGEILGRLQHPGIARIYQSGRLVTEDGERPYLTMELVQGQPLTQYANGRQLSPRERLSLLARVCDAVEYAHRAGVVHRDLKPANVLVDELGQPKVLDFGIARVVSTDTPITTMNTQVGEILGTLAYMSPEQASGDPSEVDERSDVYSLGVMLYELLSGALPYETSSRRVAAALAAIRNAEPRRLSSIHSLFRGDVETIVLTALEKDKRRRYPSPGALAADILHFLRDEPIEARPASRAYRVLKFARRNRVLVASSMAVLLSLSVGLAAALRFGYAEARQRKLAEQRESEARVQLYQSSILTTQLMLDAGNLLSARKAFESIASGPGNWEWNALRRQFDRALDRLEIPDLFDAQYLDAERLIAVDGRCRLWTWDLVTSALTDRAPFAAGAQPVALSGDGTRFVCFVDDELIVVDTLTGGECGRLPFSHGAPRPTWIGSALDRTGRRLATSTVSEDVYLVDLDGSSCVQRLDVGFRPHALRFCPDGRFLAVAGNSRLRMFDAERRSPCWTIDQAGTRFSSVAFDVPRGRILAGMNHTLEFRDLWTGAWLETLNGDALEMTPLGTPFRVELDVTGRFLAALFNYGQIRVLDLETGMLCMDSRHSGFRSSSVVFSRDGSSLASCGRSDAALRIWSVRAPVSRSIASPGGFIYPLVLSPDGALLAAGTWDGAARLWDAATGDLLATLQDDGNLHGLAFSPDGRLLASALRGDGFAVWDVLTCTRRGGARSTPAGSVTFERGGAHLAVGGADGVVGIYDSVGVELVSAARVDSHCIHALAYSPDGRTLAVGTEGGRLALLDAGTLERTAEIERRFGASEQANPLLSIDFSPDGREIATGWTNSDVIIYELPGLTRPRRLSGHRAEVFCVKFAPDGRRVASGGRDGVARLWDPVNGTLLLRLAGHQAYIYSLQFTPDGRRIATGSGDATIRLWDSATEPQAWRELALARRERAELERYVEEWFARKEDPIEVADGIARDERLSDAQRRSATALLVRRADSRARNEPPSAK